MARNKGTFNFAANFQVKMQEALDPRIVVGAKSDLINKETWPYDGDTLYLYNNMLVSTNEGVYRLIDVTKALDTDYSGWERIDAAAAAQIEVINSLESDRTDAALSANQGKVLMSEITTLAGKLTGIYTYKGTVAEFGALPTDPVAGDVYNVEAAYDGHAAGTNYAWNGTEWDALAGSIDLSGYYSKDEVDTAIKVETDRAVAEEERLAGLISANTTLAQEAKNAATANTTTLTQVTQNIGEINTILNGVADDDTDGVVGRLSAVETANTNQDTRLTNLEKLVSGGEAGEGGTTLLEMVNANAANISTLQTETIKEVESGNETLLTATTESRSTLLTPVTCKIADANDEKDGLVTAKDAKDYIQTAVESAFEWAEVE